MRKVIYIVGMTGSGKTTAAIKLSELLGLPYRQTDAALDLIGAELGVKLPSKLALRENERLFKEDRLLDIKRRAYERVFSGVKGDFIVEGFSLCYVDERAILAAVIGEHIPIFFYIDPPYELWREIAGKKGGSPNPTDFAAWQERFEPPDHQYYIVKDPRQLLMGWQQYQREGFTDKKWEALKLGDLKGKRVLDIGCNDGEMGAYCLAAGAAEVVGIDRNWRCLENAKAKGVKPLLLDVNDAGWEAGLEGFDLVLSLAMLHYVKDKERFISLCSKIGKELVLELPISQLGGFVWERYGSRKELWLPTRELIKELLQDNFTRVEDGGRSPAPDDSWRIILKAGN